ncbi:hypothetical protein FM107_05280 [Sphingobacterium sp. JB170]|nr:hypothetical protein FM107_05280 [Sphingobacterium sp. JB170]
MRSFRFYYLGVGRLQEAASEINRLIYEASFFNFLSVIKIKTIE